MAWDLAVELIHATVQLEQPLGDGTRTVGTGFLIEARVLKNFSERQERMLVDFRMVMSRLRAVAAVFAAMAATPVDDGTEIDVLAAEVLLQGIGTMLQFLQGSREKEGKVIAAFQAEAL